MLRILAAALLGCAAAAPAPASFWPLPLNLTQGGAALPVSPALRFSFSPANNPVGAEYAAWVSSLIFSARTPGGPPPPGALSVVNVFVADVNALLYDADESYTLEVPADGSPATITANTTQGARHALQTLSQAIAFDFDTQQYVLAGAPLRIADAPRFAFRGLMVDTSRHWLALPLLRRVVDSLAMAHLNVLHWHAVDWQAWPLQSESYPALWSAAWSPRERYTLADVSSVVAYARSRGVRVIFEFDTPGHASSMCVAYPALCVQDVPGCGAGDNNPLSPVPVGGRNVTLDAIQAVLAEVAALAPEEPLLHLGGDEVDQGCWNRSAAVRGWMAGQGLATTDDVYAYFVAAIDAFALKALKRTPMRWEEAWDHFGTALDKSTVIHAWLGRGALIQATDAGYRAVYSVDDTWYLPHLAVTWQQVYDTDPLQGVNATELVLGGEECMWGEWADGADFENTVWPRLAAAAERLWSYDAITNSSAAGVAERLGAFRCLLLERGIGAAPRNNAQARDAPPGPGSCLSQ